MHKILQEIPRRISSQSALLDANVYIYALNWANFHVKLIILHLSLLLLARKKKSLSMTIKKNTYNLNLVSESRIQPRIKNIICKWHVYISKWSHHLYWSSVCTQWHWLNKSNHSFYTHIYIRKPIKNRLIKSQSFLSLSFDKTKTSTRPIITRVPPPREWRVKQFSLSLSLAWVSSI